MREDVTFLSDGRKLAGHLYLPEGDGPFPLVVMAGGWCYVKELVQPYYAQAFVDAGARHLIFTPATRGDAEPIRRRLLDELLPQVRIPSPGATPSA